jgi:hypothetical protein
MDLIDKTDPKRIYVENISSFFNLPFGAARYFCEMAVKQGIFTKKYGVVCRNEECQRIIVSYDQNPADKSEQFHVNCEQCELLERYPYEFDLKDTDIIEYYQLVTADGGITVPEQQLETA